MGMRFVAETCEPDLGACYTRAFAMKRRGKFGPNVATSKKDAPGGGICGLSPAVVSETQYFECSLATPAEQLACDEALLDWAEESDHPGFLRFFEPDRFFVVLGYGKKLREDVSEEGCRELGIPILRRCSGGGTVLQGPGCLNYTLVLPLDAMPGLETISSANETIMRRMRDGLASLLGPEVTVSGYTDLAMGERKFCGNAQRRKRRCLLFHGCFLLDLDLDLVARTLRQPVQQPDYRRNREHREFLRNVPIEARDLRNQLREIWNARTGAAEELGPEIGKRVAALVAAKYGSEEWNRRL